MDVITATVGAVQVSRCRVSSIVTTSSTSSTVAGIATTTTTLPPTCADLAPAACASPSLPRSIATSLKRGCSLLARAPAGVLFETAAGWRGERPAAVSPSAADEDKLGPPSADQRP
jgi:hypothetical protein